MSLRSTFQWNHDFPRLVSKLGFKFMTNKPKVVIDWNLIGCVNIEEVELKSDVIAIERHIQDVIYYSLQPQEICVLDPKFVKLFRIAQLNLEYFLFCLHYLDQGFVQLQDNLAAVKKENDELYEELARKEEYIEKYKKKIENLQISRYHCSDIANTEFYECPVCKKQFVNESYLTSHQNRRQHKTSETDMSPIKYREETDKLFSEIKQLKDRLNGTGDPVKAENEKSVNGMMKSSENRSDIQVQTELNRKNTIFFDNCVQCDMLAENFSENLTSVDCIREELKKWREEEASQILIQLENIKKQFNADLENLRQTQMHCVHSPTNSEISIIQAQQAHLEAFEQNLEQKLISNVERLKSELAAQEEKWKEKLMRLEMKSDVISELALQKLPSVAYKPKMLSIKHNSPVLIEHKSSTEVTAKTPPMTVNQGKEIKETKDDTKRNVSYKPEKLYSEEVNEITKENRYSKKSNSPEMHSNSSSTKTSPEHVKYKDNITKLISTNSQRKKLVQFKTNKPVSRTIFTKTTDLSNASNTQRKGVNIDQKHESFLHETQGDFTSKHSLSTLGKASLTSLKEAILADPNFLLEFRKTMVDVLHMSLKELGVDPEWNSLPQHTLAEHFKTIQHNQKFLTKIYPQYHQLRNEILHQVDNIVTEKISKKAVSSNPIHENGGFPPYKEYIENKSPKVVPPVGIHKQHNIPIKSNVSPHRFESKNSTIQKTCVNKVNTSPRSKPFKTCVNKETPQKVSTSSEPKPLQKSQNNLTKIENSEKVKKVNCKVPSYEINNADYKSRMKDNEPSQTVIETMKKVKDRVLSALKTSNSSEPKEKNLRPWGQRQAPVTTSSNRNITKGVYKLTIDRENTASKNTVLSVTPILKHSPTKSLPESTKNIQTDNDSTSLTSSNASIQFNNILKVEHHIPPTIAQNSDKDLSKTPHSINNVLNVSPQKGKTDPFVVKAATTIPKAAAGRTKLESPRRINLLPDIQEDSSQDSLKRDQFKSMYGNTDIDFTTEKSSSSDDLVIQEVSKKPLKQIFNKNDKNQVAKGEEIEKDATAAKKRVLFSEQTVWKKSKFVREEASDAIATKNNNFQLKEVQIIESKIPKPLKEKVALKNHSDEEDSTSISSSVFDRSTQNNNSPRLTNSNEGKKATKDKSKTRHSLSEDLVLSDFDFSSD